MAHRRLCARFHPRERTKQLARRRLLFGPDALLPPVTCQILPGGAQLKCSSTMTLRARSVSVTVFGADGKKASGKAKVTAKRGAKKGTYTLTMKTPVTFLPGRFVYKHVATTTRKGEKLLAVRVLNLK